MKPIRRLTIPLLLLGAAMPCNILLAQSVSQVALFGGTATDARGVRSNAVTLAPSTTFTASPNTSVSLGGSATYFENAAWSVGAGLSLASRADLGAGFAVATDIGAAGSHTSFDANLVTADLTPALEWSASGFTLFGGGHAALGYTAVSQPSAPGPLPIPAPGTRTLVSETRTAIAPVYGAQWRVPFSDAHGAFSVGYREEPMVVSGVSITDRMATASLGFGSVTLAGTAGTRDARDERVSFSSGSASIAFMRSLSLNVGGGTYPSNRLTGAAGGNFMSLGLSMRFGAAERAVALPSPSGVPGPAKGATRFTIRVDDATRVELAGDFTEWEWMPAKRADNGVWYADVVVAPGEYRYAFRVNGKEWRVPEGAVAVDDGFGGKSAFVTIRGAGPAQEQH